MRCGNETVSACKHERDLYHLTIKLHRGMFPAQSKYLKHFLIQGKKMHQGDTNGRLATPQRYPLNRQFKNGRRRFDLAIKVLERAERVTEREREEVMEVEEVEEEGGAIILFLNQQ